MKYKTCVSCDNEWNVSIFCNTDIYICPDCRKQGIKAVFKNPSRKFRHNGKLDYILKKSPATAIA